MKKSEVEKEVMRRLALAEMLAESYSVESMANNMEYWELQIKIGVYNEILMLFDAEDLKTS